jgi:hypothetical protein
MRATAANSLFGFLANPWCALTEPAVTLACSVRRGWRAMAAPEGRNGINLNRPPACLGAIALFGPALYCLLRPVRDAHKPRLMICEQ